MAQPTLRTDRLILRPLRAADGDAFGAMNADPQVMRHYPATLDRALSDALLARLIDDAVLRGYGMWALERPEVATFVGFVGLAYADFEAPFTPCVEIGWRIAAAHWGRGYATEAARAALAHAFGELALDRVLAWTTPENLASRRVMEKLGMARVPSLDFDHPRVPAGHRLRRHIVHRALRPPPRAQG